MGSRSDSISHFNNWSTRCDRVGWFIWWTNNQCHRSSSWDFRSACFLPSLLLLTTLFTLLLDARKQGGLLQYVSSKSPCSSQYFCICCNLYLTQEIRVNSSNMSQVRSYASPRPNLVSSVWCKYWRCVCKNYLTSNSSSIYCKVSHKQCRSPSSFDFGQTKKWLDLGCVLLIVLLIIRQSPIIDIWSISRSLWANCLFCLYKNKSGCWWWLAAILIIST